MEKFFKNVQDSYNSVAEDYAKKFIDELDEKPFDRKMLELLCDKTEGLGMLCDLGCGPGNVARYLHKLGRQVCGLDLSNDLVELAKKLNPEIKFYKANMLDMNIIADSYFGGAAAFYSLIHIPKNLIAAALKEIYRTIKDNGALLIAFHTGNEIRHFDEWWGKKVNLDFIFYQTDEMKKYIVEAGFMIDYVIEREPVKEVEVETKRSYILARKNKA